MKILVFSTDDFLPPAGGAELAFKEIAKRCPDISFDLICARLRPGTPRMQTIGNVTIHRIGWGIPRIDRLLLALGGAPYAYRLHRRQHYDVVWAILASYGGLAATWFKRFTGVPFLLTLQEGTRTDIIERRTAPFRWLFRDIFRSANGLQAISTYLLAWGKRMGFSGALSQVVPNGVDYARFHEAFAEKKRDAIVTLISVSRFVPKNGVEDLVAALALLPSHIHLILCGDGPLRKKLEQQIKQRGLTDRVHMTGFLPHDRTPVLFKSADIFVRPSLSEGLGSAFLEAMAAGIPVIGTAVGGITDFLVDGETGFICQPKDPESIARTVQRILEMDPVERARITENASRMVQERFSWDRIAADMRELFKEVSSRRAMLAKGVFIFSLDTEIAWGTGGNRRYRYEYDHVREVIHRVLALCEQYHIAITWAVVGQLMVNGDNPWWHAPDVVSAIRSCRVPQEIGSHSFEHRLDEPSCTAEQMDADLKAACAVADAQGIPMQSFVFPKNRVKHLDILERNGFRFFRGPNQSWYERLPVPVRRLAHVVDDYLIPSAPTVLPKRVGGLWNIPGSYFYVHRRGWASILPVASRVRKVRAGLRAAVKQRRVFHLWCHPFNLASDADELLHGIELIFQEVSDLRSRGLLDQMTMGQFGSTLS